MKERSLRKNVLSESQDIIEYRYEYNSEECTYYFKQKMVIEKYNIPSINIISLSKVYYSVIR
jgi:hypothetical protein